MRLRRQSHPRRKTLKARPMLTRSLRRNRSTTIIFTKLWLLMAPGSRFRTTAGAGNRPLQWLIRVGVPIAIVAAGFGPTAAGIGNPIIRGAGRHSTMADGIVAPDMAGFGRRTRSGDRPGSLGVIRTLIAAGRPFLLELTSMWEGVSGLAAAM